MKDELQALQDIVRIGTVSSVNEEDRTARVIFPDKSGLVSGPLKVIQNPPDIEISETVTENPEDEPKEDDNDGENEIPQTKTETEVKPWLPKEGQFVLCIYLPTGGDGFIIGAI